MKGLVSMAIVSAGAGLAIAVSVSGTTIGAAQATPAGPMAVDPQTAFVAANCATCHSDRGKAGGLSLTGFDAAKLDGHVETAEKMIRKLRAGMMPPAGVRNRPTNDTLQALATSLETRIDRAAARVPAPGRRAFPRLNRAEYARAVRDLLDVDVDVTAFLPADTISQGFDNVADAQSFSATNTEGYLRAASRIATLAVGDRRARPAEATYKVLRTEAQLQHVDGTPWGTRGGVSVVHTFPADGEYAFRIMLHSVPSGRLYASAVRDEQIEVSVNGARVALLDIDYRMSEADENGMNLVTPPVHVNAGPQRVSAAFLKRFDGPVDDLMAPIEYTLADTQIGEFGYGITTQPHLRDLSITGPFTVTGISETPSRRRIFTCRPTATAEEEVCATAILQRLAGVAYRRPTTRDEIDALLTFYRQGRDAGGFEAGIRLGIQAMLVSPRFLFRIERAPASSATGVPYRIADAELAARLSFFLWGAAPDEALLGAASSGTLRTSTGMAREVHRMLKDPRSEALATRFASQWLRLQDVEHIRPDALLFPSYDHRLAQSFRRETELFFDSIVREDRSVLDLLRADYTFMNERIARHYGVRGVAGDAFQRVTLGPELDARRGLLGQGSILMLTSLADRTSPVQRGKWIMEVLLGSPPPPPPPPPDVPGFEESTAVAHGRRLSTRQRMEEHRRSPACASCHRVIDPLGLTLENFDVTGQWRIKDSGVPVDANGDLYDGTKMTGPASLRQALLSHSDTLLRTFTEYLMTYALGRRVEYFDQPTIRATVSAAAANDHRFSSFVLGIATSPAFQMSQAEQATVRSSKFKVQSSNAPR